MFLFDASVTLREDRSTVGAAKMKGARQDAIRQLPVRAINLRQPASCLSREAFQTLINHLCIHKPITKHGPQRRPSHMFYISREM